MPKLLLADDSLTTQKVVKLTFADEGIDVISADDGDTALQLVSQHRPDIVLADVNMPGLNGYEICEIIRKREESRSTPVVLLVGSFEPFDLTEARRVGATDYLTKPFSSIRKLVSTVSDLLKAPEPAPQQQAAVEEPGSEPEGPSDIDVLYTESIADAVDEMEPAAAEPDVERGEFGDPALDDELIETTYTAPLDTPPEQIGREAAAGVGSATTAELSAPDLSVLNVEEPTSSDQDAGEDRGEIAGEVTEPLASDEYVSAPSSEAGSDLSREPAVDDVATFDDTRDETYFEPEAESGVSEPGVEGPASSPGEFRMEAMDSNTDTGRLERVVDEPETEAQKIDEQQDAGTPAADTEPPMPWDSIVAPSNTGFEFDESNLLELPVGVRPTQPEQPEKAPASRVADQRDIVTPELVDRIVRTAALRISEEFVRQIAERVVPQVVEEVLTEHSADEANR
jgi:CheY-like chemotaxis protein